MSLSHLSPAERLATFRRAMRDGIGMEAARSRLVADLEAGAAARLAAKTRPCPPSNDRTEPRQPYWQQW